MKIPIHIWQSFNEKDQLWEHNHIEEVEKNPLGVKPKPINDYQRKMWKGVKWRRFDGYLDEDYCVGTWVVI